MKQETSRQKQAAETRHKIYTCATELFAYHNYENISVNDICKAAGVSVGAFYHHFVNKESILNEGYRVFDKRLESEWESDVPEPGFKSIEFLVTSQLGSVEKMGSHGAGQYFRNQLTNKDKYILNKNRFFYKKVRENIILEINNGNLVGDGEIITGEILSICRGTIYDWCLNGGSYDLVAHGLKRLDMIFNYYKN